MNLEAKIEAILFYKNEPMEVKKLSKILNTKENVSEDEIKIAVHNLSKSLEGRGISLIQTETQICLATAGGMRETIEQIAKEEMRSEIGKAGLETLAIILYNGPISRREVDYIRGVNSTFIIRNLSLRGLIEREANTEDQRSFKYRGSLSLLAHLGLNKFEDLPEFDLFSAQGGSALGGMEKAEEVKVELDSETQNNGTE